MLVIFLFNGSFISKSMKGSTSRREKNVPCVQCDFAQINRLMLEDARFTVSS